MNRIRWYGPTVALLTTVLLILLAGPSLVHEIVYAKEKAHIELASDSLEQSQLLAELSESFRHVAEVVQPSVVSIEIYKKSPLSKRPRKFRRPFDLRQWFDSQPDAPDDHGGDDDDDDKYERYDQPTITGAGSGWVYGQKGHIVTNYHVIKDADKIDVHFANGDKHTAKVVNTDPETDIAVLQVDSDRLHPASLAHLPAQQGDIVFAFGSPLRFKFSVSQGIVSATDRQLNILSRKNKYGFPVHGYENFIQTDAAINQGNSGGPLTNIFGHVVGMNTAIATRTRYGGEGFMGLGFAIPIDLIEEVVERILTEGKFERGYLGIYFDSQPLDAKRAATFGYNGTGVAIVDLIDGGPAMEAGILHDDILTKINGTPIENGRQLRRLIAATPPGTDINVEVFRNGEAKSIKVTLAPKPDNLTYSGGPEAGPKAQQDDNAPAELLLKLGIERVQTFTEELADRLGLKSVPGILVIKVRPGSIATGDPRQPPMMKRGQVITHVMSKPVENVKKLVHALLDHKDETLVRLRVMDSNGRFSNVWLEMPHD